MDADCTDRFRQDVLAAIANASPLELRGSGSKAFLGHASQGEPLELGAHAGILAYAPDELVITARAGTRIADIDAALAEHGQMLGFEPPRFGADASLGGTLAAGLSGPRRASAGAARDFVLGVRVLDGVGDVLRFGGEVIKNVAGYDVSRLMVGAFGTLGILLDASVKVVPRPRSEQTCVLDLDAASALEHVRRWSQRPLPISASAILEDRLYVRLSGADAAVRAAQAEIGGASGEMHDFWRDLREQALPFFADSRTLWRLSVSPGAPIAATDGPQLIEWQGAQRWLTSDAAPATIRAIATAAGGHAVRFRRGATAADDLPAFQALAPPLLALHQRLKQRFDPHRLFNRGRLHPEL